MSKTKMELWEKKWTDQPDSVLDAKPILETFMNKRVVEVRKNRFGNPYLVTAGTLFGSQTLEVWDADDVLYLLDVISKAKGDAISLPKGARVLVNAETETEPLLLLGDKT